jgi:asparagine synthase (glutamine-hydrolysing)
MCGIAAIYSKNREISKTQIETSLHSIAHRGPDGEGLYFNPSKKVALGHVRLAIMDTQGGHQPLYNEDRSLVLVANGEFYDFERIRHELSSKGHKFYTHSDSEIALHLFEDQGLASITQLRGEFSFIIYDQNKNELTAFRDRFGIKPLFYSIYNDQILLASEIKALFAAGVPAEWDQANVYQSMHFASLEPSTLYKNIFQVPPGHYLRIVNNQVEVKKYWDTNYPRKSELSYTSEADVIKEVKDKMEEAILLRTRSDVPIACYLSGGVDSSTVLGMANRLSNKKIPAFTIAFDHADYDESALAGTMSKYAQSPFHPIRVTNQDFADVFSEAVEKSDMPFYNGHAPARFILSREVKKAGYKVVLGGEGADELFAGYHFSQAALSGSVQNNGGHVIQSVAKVLTRLCKTPTHEILKIKNISPTLYWAARVLGFPPELASNLITRYENLQQFQDTGFIKRNSKTDPYRKFLGQFSIGENIHRAPFHIVLYLWMKSHFPQYVLAAERLDMAHAVELRLPFLDHQLFDVTKKLPASLLYKNDLNKYLLRKIAQDDVCPEVLAKLKQPFVSPPSTLGNDNPLFAMVCDLIMSQDFKNISFFNHQHIEKLLPRIKTMNNIERAPYDPVFYYLASLAVLNRKYNVT